MIAILLMSLARPLPFIGIGLFVFLKIVKGDIYGNIINGIFSSIIVNYYD